MKIILPLAALFLFLSVSEAQNSPHKPENVSFWSSMSGEDLVRNCKSADTYTSAPIAEQEEVLVCASYISGFTDGYGAALVAFNGSKQAMFCPPKEVNVGQLVKVVVKFGRDHPEKLSMNAPVFTFLALSTAYPCQAR